MQISSDLNSLSNRYWKPGIIALVFMATAYLGLRVSLQWLILLVGGAVGVAFWIEPRLGLPALIIAALLIPFDFSTGTEVKLNLATLLIPVLFVLWLIASLRTRELHWNTSAVNRPLILFLMTGLLSLIIGNGTWDPGVPRSSTFLIVQLAQWAIFVFAGLAFWLTANVKEPEVWLPRLTWTFLYAGGGVAIIWILLGGSSLVRSLSTIAFIRAAFWVLLAALAGGQLLFNNELDRGHRIYLLAVLTAVLVYAFALVDDRTSNWVGIVSVAGTLIWLRLRRLRRALLILGAVILILGLVSGLLYEFAGGDEKWYESGESRLVLIGRVVSVTLRNPITGLGPASYRPYASAEPLQYFDALWWNPQISSHNNYIDLFAQTGLLGLALFLWFAVELWRLGQRLSDRHPKGFIGGYVNAMTAAWVGSLVIMLLADWVLPFVYNIGFPGFQASLLVWLFLGGLVAVDQTYDVETG